MKGNAAVAREIVRPHVTHHDAAKPVSSLSSFSKPGISVRHFAAENDEASSYSMQESIGAASIARPCHYACGHQVDVLLGAAVLNDEAQQDFAYPGAFSLQWQRQYCSHVDATEGGFCGVFGYGWSTPLEWRLSIAPAQAAIGPRKDGKAEAPGACVLYDPTGRRIRFDVLDAGASAYSPSENILMLRTCAPACTGATPLVGPPRPASMQTPAAYTARLPIWFLNGQGRFGHLPLALVEQPHIVFMCLEHGEDIWAFAPANRKALIGGSETLPAREWLPLGRIDRLGRTQRMRYANVLGKQRLVSVQDGMGRLYALRYAQVSAPRRGPCPASGTAWQADSGVRLTGVSMAAPPNEVDGASEPVVLVRYGYSVDGDLTEVHDRHGECVHRYAYLNHLLIRHQVRQGPEHHFRYEHDEPGARVVEQCSPSGLEFGFSYAGRPDGAKSGKHATVVTDNLQRKDTYIFTGEAGRMRLTEHIRADGSSEQYRYNPAGQRTSTVDAAGRTTRHVLDNEGRAIRVQWPDGSSQSKKWDAFTGQLQSETDAEGRVTRYERDRWGRATCITAADGSMQRLVYPDVATDPSIAHLPVQITNARGELCQMTYTPSGLLEQRIEAGVCTLRCEYTPTGQLASATDSSGKSRRYRYDARGWLCALEFPNGRRESYERDANGRIIQITMHDQGARGSAGKSGASGVSGHIHLMHDPWGRLIEYRVANHSRRWRYDVAGRLIEVINENDERATLEWCPMNRLIRVVDFDGREQRAEYNAVGEMKRCTEGGTDAAAGPARIVQWEWNAAGRVTRCLLPETAAAPAQAVHYSWSRTGELLCASVWQRKGHGAGPPIMLSQVELRRDVLGRLCSEAQRLYDCDNGELEFEHCVTHTLDAMGLRTASEWRDLGKVDFARNACGTLRAVGWQGETVVALEHDALHREVRRQLLKPVLSRTLQWNADAQWRHMQWQGNDLPNEEADVARAALAPREYHYDPPGRLIGIHGSAGSVRCAYDALGRLIYSHGPLCGLQRWSFDPAGNVLALPCDDNQSAAQSGQRPEQRCAAVPDPLLQPETALARTLFWSGNRVQHHCNAYDHVRASARMRYDYDHYGDCRERIERVQGRVTELAYDARHLLVQARSTAAGKQATTMQYRCDAFGRRMAAYELDAQGRTLGIEHFGWDGALLVRIQRCGRGRAAALPRLSHTIHEPDSALPLLHLCKRGMAAMELCARPSAQPVLAVIGMSGGEVSWPDTFAKPCAAAQTEHPPAMQRQRTSSSRSNARTSADLMAQSPSPSTSARVNLVANDLAMYHYVLDHRGVPSALLDDTGHVAWAASIDAWGQVAALHDPRALHQPARLPGHYLDEATGLCFGADSIFDTFIGRRLNQDTNALISMPASRTIQNITMHLSSNAARDRPVAPLSVAEFAQWAHAGERTPPINDVLRTGDTPCTARTNTWN